MIDVLARARPNRKNNTLETFFNPTVIIATGELTLVISVPKRSSAFGQGFTVWTVIGNWTAIDSRQTWILRTWYQKLSQLFSTETGLTITLYVGVVCWINMKITNIIDILGQYIYGNCKSVSKVKGINVNVCRNILQCLYDLGISHRLLLLRFKVLLHLWWV